MKTNKLEHFHVLIYIIRFHLFFIDNILIYFIVSITPLYLTFKTLSLFDLKSIIFEMFVFSAVVIIEKNSFNLFCSVQQILRITTKPDSYLAFTNKQHRIYFRKYQIFRN